nr:MAG TPA: hypothetical protein [Caudoviricetes sp.]
MFANPCRIGLFYGLLATHIVPTPVRSVNAPAACIRWKATGKRYFLFEASSLDFLDMKVRFPVYLSTILFHFKCFPK